MVRVLLRWLINAAAIYLASRTVPGILVEDELALIGVALILGVVNAFIRPILQLLTCPLIILTLGLFTFVLNALMLLLTAWIAEFLDIGFRVDGIVP
ncbi:MAG: phage holin family protein, partial [Chloroflexi bacterium]|nr:phage holin family protein [Chloroflexota bacterium]